MILYIKRRVFLLLSVFAIGLNYSQTNNKVYIQSEKDNQHVVPFWTSYTSGVDFIETGVFLENQILYVGNLKQPVKNNKTLEKLYLQPLVQLSSASEDLHKDITIVLNVKSEAIATLSKIVSKLNQFPVIINNPHIHIVVSGNLPIATSFHEYPEYLTFSCKEIQSNLPAIDFKKIRTLSVDFKQLSQWNGKGRLTHEDHDYVTETINKYKRLEIPFGFYNTPDSKTSWRVLTELGVDIVITNQPQKCITYIKSLKHRTTNAIVSSTVYKPDFKVDDLDEKVKNIILLIGDGNGLSQISSAVLANEGALTLTQFKKIGLIKTQSLDDFTTDSAAAGTAMATGKKTNNRAIGMDAKGNKLSNIVEVLNKKGYLTGCITTDEITGATPAAFYAHRKDRSEREGIKQDLAMSKLDFFAGGGADGFDIKLMSEKFKLITDWRKIKDIDKDRIGYFLSKKSVPSIISGRKNLLAETTKAGLEFFNKHKKPFFMMIEAAKIDSFGHTNNTEGVVSEGIDFDRAITEAVKFADHHKGTLVIVTADHETSGFSVSSGNVEAHQIEGGFVSHDHTATMVPVFAYGAQSSVFTGVYENNELFIKMLRVLAE